MPEPMLTVSIVKEAAEKAGLDAVVAIGLNADRTQTDFATWGRRAEDKVYADGMADVIRSGLGYTPVPPAEDFKLQAAHLKVLYDAIVAESLALGGKYDVRLQVAALDRIFAAAHNVPTKFNPPSFDVFVSSTPATPGRPGKVEKKVNYGSIEYVLKYIGGGLSEPDLASLAKWIDDGPIGGDVWRDDYCEFLVLRNSDV